MTYRAARQYGLHGLAELVEYEVKEYDYDGLYDLLDLFEKAFQIHPRNDPDFSECVEEKIQSWLREPGLDPDAPIVEKFSNRIWGLAQLDHGLKSRMRAAFLEKLAGEASKRSSSGGSTSKRCSCLACNKKLAHCEEADNHEELVDDEPLPDEIFCDE